MTLKIRAKVKGHSRYSLEIFREDVKLFKWVRYSKFRYDRPTRSPIILEKSEGFSSTPCADEG